MRMFLVLLIVLFAALPLTAEDSEAVPLPSSNSVLLPMELPPGLEESASSAPAPSVPAPSVSGLPVSAEDLARAAGAVNRFAWVLYRHVAEEEKGNIFFSPVSISTAVTMTLAGAGGKTREAMGRALQLDSVEETAVAGVAALADELNCAGRAGDFALAVANALYGEQTYTFKETYIRFLADAFHAPLQAVDFVSAAEDVRQRINTWVEEQTARKIKDLIPSGAVNSLTRMVLVNAIYFKGNWLTPFEEDATRDAPFHRSAGEDSTVKLMFNNLDLPYHAGDVFQAVRLPYVGKRLSMVVLLPARDRGLDEWAGELSPERFTEILQAMRETEVDLYLPRFKCELSLSLKKFLVNLGMGPAFASDADFSGMSDGKELRLTDALHKAFVQVNEEGTEAAAATAMVIGTTSVRKTPVFRADRPFLFAIVDDVSGAILFLGRLMEP